MLHLDLCLAYELRNLPGPELLRRSEEVLKLCFSLHSNGNCLTEDDLKNERREGNLEPVDIHVYQLAPVDKHLR